MRVQRAPSAADQPQRPPAGVPVAAASGAPGFSAHVELDVTDLLRRLPDEDQLLAEVVVRLIAACRQERLLDHGSQLQVVRMKDGDLLGTTLDAAVNLSASGVAVGLRSLAPELPATTPRTLTVVHLSGSRIQATGDWGRAGLGVATLAGVVPTLLPADGHSLAMTQRSTARLGLTVPGSTSAYAVVRTLDTVARSVET